MEIKEWTQPEEDLVDIISKLGKCKVKILANYGNVVVPEDNILDEGDCFNSGKEAIDYIMRTITEKTPAPEEVGFNDIPFEVVQKEGWGKKRFDLTAQGTPFGSGSLFNDYIEFKISIKKRLL